MQAAIRTIEMTRKQWAAIDKDYKGCGEAGDLQTMIDCELVRVVLVKGTPAAPAPRRYAEAAPLAPVPLPAAAPHAVAQVVEKPAPAENHNELRAARQQVAAAWGAYDFSAVKPATAKRVRRQFESTFYHADVACQVASGRPVPEQSGYSGRNTKRR